MSMLMSTILAAAEHAAEAGAEHVEHKSELPFFILGGCLAAFAILISIVGFKKPDFPGSASAARGLMAFSVTIVLATMASIVYVSN